MHSDGRPLVALLAHPDDEFAIFPWLAAEAAAGRPVWCFWLTDGGWGGQDMQRREDESREVLRSFGITVGSFEFLGRTLGVRDGHLVDELERMIALVRERLARLGNRYTMLVPAWEGGHQDHDATHLIGLASSAASQGEVLQYSLYHGAGLFGPLFKVLAPLPQNGPLTPHPTSARFRLKCLAACLRYRSQWKSFVGLLPFYALRLARRDAFVLQPVDTARVREQPHAGAPLYERRGGPTWAAFSQATAHVREQIAAGPARALSGT